MLRRREFVQSIAAGAALTPTLTLSELAACDDKEPLPVAGVVTVYQPNSHADVILGKILAGYDQQGGHGPKLKLVSLYVDQYPKADMSRALSKKHGFKIYSTIADTITQGGNSVNVRGVLSIGEHGSYPQTAKTGQRKYPRRRFFDEIAATLERYDAKVPVFNDKHLSYRWEDAKAMYDRAKKLQLPFMAGSSLPVAWRVPGLVLDQGVEIEEAIGIGYGGPESYGFHALEAMQCMIERRKGGESGVASVQALTGDAIWEAEKKGLWSRELLEAGLSKHPARKPGKLEEILSSKSPFYLIQYRDGLRATCAMLNGVTGEFGFAARLRNRKEPVACRVALENKRPYGHFAWLLKAIEAMIHSGKPSYPVERTLLTTGILDRVMHSLADRGAKLTTPELAIQYQANNWGHATTNRFDPPNAS